MECAWFFGADLHTAAILISLLGIVHPAWWVVWARRFRSPWFLALYALTGTWSLVSFLLLVGVLARLEVLWWVWIWFSLVLAPLMALGCLLMSVGFFILRMPRVASCPAVGFVCYLLTLYCICAVNTGRRALADRAGAGAPRPHQRSVAVLREASNSSDDIKIRHLANRTSTTTVLPTPVIKVVRRGYCALPTRKPDNGVYMAALPDNSVAQPGRRYHRLRLWVYCNKYYRPRHLQYAFCYSGGWNLPLPDCVKAESYYEEYYDYTAAMSTDQPTECVPPPPPAHGYFTRDARITRRYMRLSVRCDPMHILVGWQRVTCRDGQWDRPVPQCVFIDTNVCTLMETDNRMIHTCLSSDLYAGAYRCRRGLVPHGSVVEASCPKHFYVWGSFDYLYCINGLWHPRQLVDNIRCEYAPDIYRHYEIEALRNKTKMATAGPAPDLLEHDSARPAGPAGRAAAAASASPAAAPAAPTGQTRTGPAMLSRTKLTNTTPHVPNFSNKINTTVIWKHENETDDFSSSNTAKINVWATPGNPDDLLCTISNRNTISKYLRRSTTLPATRHVSTSRRKIDITDIWKGPIDDEETTAANFAETRIWKPRPVGALIDTLIKPDKDSETGALSDNKPAKVEEWPSQRDRDWFGPGAAPPERGAEGDAADGDGGIHLNTARTLATSWTSREGGGEPIQMDIWKSTFTVIANNIKHHEQQEIPKIPAKRSDLH